MEQCAPFSFSSVRPECATKDHPYRDLQIQTTAPHVIRWYEQKLERSDARQCLFADRHYRLQVLQAVLAIHRGPSQCGHISLPGELNLAFQRRRTDPALRGSSRLHSEILARRFGANAAQFPSTPRFWIFRKVSSNSGASISAMGREPIWGKTSASSRTAKICAEYFGASHSTLVVRAIPARCLQMWSRSPALMARFDFLFTTLGSSPCANSARASSRRVRALESDTL